MSVSLDTAASSEVGVTGTFRINTDGEHLYIRVIGESDEPGVRENLDRLAALSNLLNLKRVEHSCLERKKAGGGHEPDAIKLPLR